MIRAVITATTAAAGKLLRFDATGRAGESFTDREALQQYGFQSRPPDGTEAVLMRRGNMILMLGSDNREYRIAMEKGELVIGTNEGDLMHWKRNRKVEWSIGSVAAAGQLDITIAGPMQGKVNITAGGEVNVSAPTVRLGGLALATAMGIVTGACSCAITGAPHAVTSQTAKATL